jgi:hypothetical protein
MKNTLFLLFTLISFLTLSQKYPVQTILKGDSVVILTIQQYSDIELLLDNQRSRVSIYKNDITEQEEKIDSLICVINDKSNQIDTLNSVIIRKLSNYDSLQSRNNTIEHWLYEASVDNAYLYYSYKDSTIMSIDLSSYILIGNKRSGNFALVRIGTSYEDSESKNYNRLYPQEPDLGWELYYKEKWRPVVIKFPYKIKK